MALQRSREEACCFYFSQPWQTTPSGCAVAVRAKLGLHLCAGLCAHTQRVFSVASQVGSLTSRLQTDCQAITRCVATNLNIALRNALQAFGG